MDTNDGRVLADQALVSDEAATHLRPPGFDPSRKSTSERLSKDFKIVSTSDSEGTLLQLSGPIETQDQLDAVVSILGAMREWLSCDRGLK